MEFEIFNRLILILEVSQKDIWIWKGSHLKSIYEKDFHCSLITDEGSPVIHIEDSIKEDWISMKELVKITIHKRINLTLTSNTKS